MKKTTVEQLEYYRDEVCGRCPGSLWGAKSICRVHQRSIGEIEACPQWEVKESRASYHVRDSDRHVIRTEQMELVEEELKDYPWMVREIERLRGILEEVGSGLTGVYGLDGALPRGKGGHADSVHREAQKREKYWNRMKQLEEKVTRIDSAAERLRDDRQRTILECIMEGQRMNRIAQHIGVSRQRLHELKLELVRLLAEDIFGDDRKGAS
ncbi:hypothetical protein FE783_19310 [Paenibacillus mesophilus]|uniref:hypothetical protein n=1 Tax=Paenibacillus mesophilus TaxID=2582849 RepID=UPI00110F28A4|nr:hypothetical protein [Paenibacillus mesophilus]TMV48103.1 hypothetical protein FE783_19310 [Paenibacillus mesophilus]